MDRDSLVLTVGTSFTPAQEMTGSFDLEAIVRAIPSSYTIKGMYCARFMSIVGDDWAELSKTFDAPPKAGRYLPFHDYPQTDYSRLVVAAGLKNFPKVSPREAVRLVARQDIQTFAASLIGRMLLSLTSDARGVLLRAPESYARMSTGSTLRATDLDARTVRIEFEGYYGLREYTVGQVEGTVMHYGGAPRVEIHELGPARVAFDIEHLAK